MAKLIGVDVGGTFTDVVFHDTTEGTTHIHKLPSTNHDPSQGVLAGILQICERGGIAPAELDQIYHGTTVATNAILENKGARAGMLTTAGFRDVLHIGRHQRPQHYSIMQEIPWQDRPLVRRRDRKVVAERIIPPTGAVETPLDEAGVRRAAREFREDGISSIAVCFLFSYLNPAHEERAKAIILDEYPDAFVTTSSAVSPQIREFERFTTTAMNAFVGPLVRQYIGRLSAAIGEAGIGANLHVMLSNGGVGTAKMVCEEPVRTLLSGPAAGVLMGQLCCRTSGRRNLITFDVGGTSADIAVIEQGAYAESSARETSIAGFPVLVPMIDIHTIGAGGGSIAAYDDINGFRVGPESAGAQPGPAAYGRGGRLPTVTDAHVVLGRLDPDNFLGGEMALNTVAASAVIGTLADALGLTPHAAAEGVLRVVNNNMANAIRERTVQKGLDPRRFSLVAYGGAGPLHAVDVARLLGTPEVIVPEFPGIGSAVGLLTSDLKYDLVGTFLQNSDALDLARLSRHLGEMRDRIAAQFAEDGVAPDTVAYRYAAELRYVGQGYELRVEFPDCVVTGDTIAAAFADFHDRHRKEYGHAFPDAAIEIVNLRVAGMAETQKIQPRAHACAGTVADALVRDGHCHFRTAAGLQALATPFYARERLPVGVAVAGPAVILQKDTTTVVPPDCHFTRDAGGDVIITIQTGD
ncbi:hydantoinase/oxoprolinase family protein [Sphingomonas flavalba]|uniref:hydantoinase/oxoprolinase family protein n=1 Tax=Sphingomonas flavalba TaxID=2559804 RepID=UPI0039E0CB0F